MFLEKNIVLNHLFLTKICFYQKKCLNEIGEKAKWPERTRVVPPLTSNLPENVTNTSRLQQTQINCNKLDLEAHILEVWNVSATTMLPTTWIWSFQIDGKKWFSYL